MIDQVAAKTLGIIWITKEKLGQELAHFNDLNYLSNNLLIKNIKSSHATKNFFLTKAFGKPFFIAHLLNNDKTKEELLNVLDITKEITEPGKEVLILTDDLKYVEYLNKKNSNLTFVTLS